VIAEQPTASIRPAVRTLIATSLAAAFVGIVGAALRIGWLDYAQWLYVPPLAVALVLAGGLTDRRGWWWLAGLVFSWLGDVLGGAWFPVLLGCFLVAHVCYVVALLPTRAQSLLGRIGSLPYLLLGLAGAVVLVPAAGATLAVPVALYAAILTLMALLASAGGRAGVVGGVLFMVSDLVLGIGTFVVDLSPAVQTLVVIGTYVPAQVLLLIGLLTLLPQAEQAAAPAARTPRTGP
jgi:uncharacterized membrane protein YhhN